MKKIIALLLVICFGLMFTACDVVEEPTHVCEFVAEWSTDETHHWHACKDESCTLIDGKEEHSFSWVTDKEPTVTEQGEKHEECECGLKKSEGTAIEKLVEEPSQPDINQVTEEEFYSALKFEGITSFSCDTYSLAVKYDGDLSPIGTHYYENKMFVKNNIALFTYGEGWEAEAFSEIYVEVLEGKTYEYFEFVGLGMVRADVTDTVESLGMPLLPSPEFWEEGFIKRSRIDYDDFTYSDGQYVGTMKADADDNTLVDSILKFENGKLVYMRVDYEVEGYDVYDVFEFYKYNQTEVTLPTEYTDMTIPGGGSGQPSEWEMLFIFDNVTISQTCLTEYEFVYDGTPVDMPDETTSETLKVQGEKWLYQEDYTIYFDGENAYKNGVLDEDSEQEDELFLYCITNLSSYEALLTETADGVYQTTKLEGPYGYDYDNLVIVVVDGKLSSITYSQTTSSSSDTSTMVMKNTYTYTFTEWGTTVAENLQ